MRLKFIKSPAMLALIGAAFVAANGSIAAGAGLVVQQIDGGFGPSLPLHRAATVTLDEPYSAYSARVVLCNDNSGIVSVSLENSMHPMISQNLYRLRNGRFQQIGMSWVHHLPVIVNEDFCETGNCGAPFGTINAIHPNCSTTLAAPFLATQFRLGPRFEVNPLTGVAPAPFTSVGNSGANALSKRLRVRHSDLSPLLNPGARYFIEVQIVNSEDRLGNRHHDNVSYREVIVQETTPGVFDLIPTGITTVGEPAITAWAALDSSVELHVVDVADDGRFYWANRASQISPTRWRFNWALYNQDSRRSASGLDIAISPGTIIESARFVDVDYHSGDGHVFGTNFSGTDWPLTVDAESIRWATDSFSVNPNANAVRWGTQYGFELVTNAPPNGAAMDIELFRSAARASISVPGIGPGMPGTGACCLSNGSCTTVTELSCQNLGGVYAGDSITCGQAACVQPGASTLRLETVSDCPGDSNGANDGDIVNVEVWMRDLLSSVSGFQAFLLYDPLLLEFRPNLSSYTLSPFGTHLTSIAMSEVSSGRINIDGSSGFGGGGTSSDTHLATLAFVVRDGADCQSTRVQFRQNLPFRSELSEQGVPISTRLEPTALLTFDDVAPIIVGSAIAACYPDTTSAELAAIAASPATDNCTDAMNLDYQAIVFGDPCESTITVIVMDECGNAAETSYMTRIDDTPPTLESIVDDIAVVAPNGTCEAVVTFSTPDFSDDCTSMPTVVCQPPSGSVFGVGTTQVICTANDECGNETQVSFDVSVDAVRDRLELRIRNPRDCYDEGDRICVDLVMTCLDQPVTGFNAFVSYDAGLLDFVPAASSYTNTPFPVHIASPITSTTMGATGEIDLDGSVLPGGSGVEDDALLATMCFDVKPGMGGQIYSFEFRTPPTPTIASELSIAGSPVPTVLANDSTDDPMPRLRLVTTTIRECYLPNDLVCVELQMACLGPQDVTGFNAFIDFDPAVLRFESGVYTNTPFPIHLTPIDPVGGRLVLDGSAFPGSPGTNQNAVLATLCFRIQKSAPGTSSTIDFGPPPTPSINSELSLDGVPIPTILQPTGILTRSTMGLRVCYEPSQPICVLLEATCLDVPITGYTAEVVYDNVVLEFLPGPSGYEPGPFSTHLADPIVPVINGSNGEISLDGAVPPMAPGVIDDTILASICFDIRPGFEASGGMIAFQTPMPGLESRFLDNDGPVATHLRDAPTFGLAGDINIDGSIDFTDLSLFTDVLLNIDIDENRRLLSDLNCDSRADGLDIAEFVKLLLP